MNEHLPSGTDSIIRDSFRSVFAELNLATETWFQETRLLTTGKDRYSRFIQDAVSIFPLFATSQSASVEDIYVKVNISTEIERERYRSIDQIERSLIDQKNGKIRTESRALLPIDAINATKNGLALIGSAGSGKTTALKNLTLQIAKGAKIRGKRRLPAYFAVRDLANERMGIMGAARSLLSILDVQATNRLINTLLRHGNLVILLDGLDETDEEHQRTLLRDLAQISCRFPGVILCVSARPYSLSIGMAHFTKWEILPFSLSDRSIFIEKWFNAIDPKKGARLLEESKGQPGIFDLGSNPLLLSIVCALYYNDLNIPDDPDELYGRAVEGLMGIWDAFRNIARKSPLAGLSVRRRIVLLSWMAASLFERGKIVFSARDLERTGTLDRAAEAIRTKLPQPEELLNSLYNDFGILVERAPGLYSFSHLTIQEYLVAMYIVDNRAEDRLVAMNSKKEWNEIIRLVAKMLPRAGSFMERLTSETNLENAYEVSVLRAAWSARPVCSGGIRKQLMQTVVGRIRQSLVDSDVRPTVDGLRVKEKKWTLAHTASDLRHILKNSGFTSEELGCRQIPLIDFEPAKSKPWNALSEKRSMESLPARRDFEEVDVDRALADWSSGISGALEILIPLVTDDLKRVARRLLAQSINSERDLEPEELVSELFFELVRMETTHARIGDPASLAGFLSFAHHQMSRIIYRRLRERASTRRFSGISINKALWGSDSATSVSQSSEVTIVDLDEALTVLEETEPELSKVVELRFFGGLTNTEIASTLEVSISTVGKQWRTARTWLRNQLTKPNEVVS